MPRISEFFGLVVYMYWFDVQKHKTPHFHVRYKGIEATFDLSGNVIEGNLGNTAERLVRSWCELRKTELQRAWSQAVNGKEVPWVLPLP